MAVDKFSKEELDTLLKALSAAQLPLSAKRAIKKQVHWLCLDPGTGTSNSAMYQSILKKLGYQELPPRTLKSIRKASVPAPHAA